MMVDAGSPVRATPPQMSGFDVAAVSSAILPPTASMPATPAVTVAVPLIWATLKAVELSVTNRPPRLEVVGGWNVACLSVATTSGVPDV